MVSVLGVRRGDDNVGLVVGQRLGQGRRTSLVGTVAPVGDQATRAGPDEHGARPPGKDQAPPGLRRPRWPCPGGRLLVADNARFALVVLAAVLDQRTVELLEVIQVVLGLDRLEVVSGALGIVVLGQQDEQGFGVAAAGSGVSSLITSPFITGQSDATGCCERSSAEDMKPDHAVSAVSLSDAW